MATLTQTTTRLTDSIKEIGQRYVGDADLPLEEAQKFIEHHLKAEECGDLYTCLRRVQWDEKKRKKQ